MKFVKPNRNIIRYTLISCKVNLRLQWTEYLLNSKIEKIKSCLNMQARHWIYFLINCFNNCSHNFVTEKILYGKIKIPWAITVLKETVMRYNVHCTFLNLSKTFHKVNYNILLLKLIESDLSLLLIKIIKCINN